MKPYRSFCVFVVLALAGVSIMSFAMSKLVANDDLPGEETKPVASAEAKILSDGMSIQDMETPATGPLFLGGPTVPSAPTAKYRSGTTAPSIFLGGPLGSWFLNGGIGGEALYKHPDVGVPEQYDLVYDGSDPRFWYVHEVDNASGTSYPDYAWAVDCVRTWRGHAVWSQRPDVDNGKWKFICFAKAIDLPKATPTPTR
jgi:hypothetical protein